MDVSVIWDVLVRSFQSSATSGFGFHPGNFPVGPVTERTLFVLLLLNGLSWMLLSIRKENFKLVVTNASRIRNAVSLLVTPVICCQLVELRVYQPWSTVSSTLLYGFLIARSFLKNLCFPT